MAERKNMYDVVYPLKEQENHVDLLYSLRSLEKYGGNCIGNVFVVGDCPKWIRNVIHIPTEQCCEDKHISTRQNRNIINNCKLISENYIYMNDDFILSKPVESWEEICSFNMGTLQEKEEKLLANQETSSPWWQGFKFNRELLQKIGIDNPINFEFHGAMIINRNKRNVIKHIDEIKKYWLISEPLLFERSIYGNLFGCRTGKKIKDNKLFSDFENEEILTENGFFSVKDNLIKNSDAPKLNAWLEKEFPNKSRFEKLVI